MSALFHIFTCTFCLVTTYNDEQNIIRCGKNEFLNMSQRCGLTVETGCIVLGKNAGSVIRGRTSARIGGRAILLRQLNTSLSGMSLGSLRFWLIKRRMPRKLVCWSSVTSEENGRVEAKLVNRCLGVLCDMRKQGKCHKFNHVN